MPQKCISENPLKMSKTVSTIIRNH